MNAQKVKDLGKAKGWLKVETFAARVGVNKRTASNVLKGKLVKPATAEVFAQALGVPVGKLLEDSDSEDAEAGALRATSSKVEDRRAQDEALTRKAWGSLCLGQLAEYLAERLQDDPALGPGQLVVGGAGHVYPFIHFALGQGQRWQVNSILGEVARERPRDDCFAKPAAAEDYWRERQSFGEAKDGMTYRLTEVVRKNGHLALNAAPGTFRDCVITEQWLERELLLALGKRKTPPTPDKFEKFLKSQSAWGELLKHLGRQPLSRLLHGTRFRSTSIAMSALVAFRDDRGRWCALIGLRSDSATRSRMFHVVPSAVFHSTTYDPEGQWDLEDFLYREYLEELFCEEWEGKHDRRYRSRPAVKFLRALLEAGEAKLYLTGFGYSLWSLRPEMLLLLRIDTPDWYRVHHWGEIPDRWQTLGLDDARLQFNKEFLPVSSSQYIALSREGTWLTPQGLEEPLSWGLKSAHVVPVGSPLHPAHWVPPGAAALWLGWQVLREEVQSEAS